MSTWNFRVALLAATTILVLTGCTTAPSGATFTSESSGLEQPDITVAAVPSADLAGLYVAQDDGLFAKVGLHVTIKKIAGSQAVIAAQLKGQVDISAGAYVAYFLAQAAGARFRILAEASTLRPGTKVLLTAADSHVTTIAGLVGKKIGINAPNSLGILLISALLQEYGVSPKKVEFVPDPQGFPAMPGHLQQGEWVAAFLAEPYVAKAEEDYGDQPLADLDQGAMTDFPIDGYVAAEAWVTKHPKTAAAFVRAIEEGQALAESDPNAVQAAMAVSDQLTPAVTAVMALPNFPTGPVDKKRMQRTADAMLQFGMLGPQYATEVEQGTLVKSMIGP